MLLDSDWEAEFCRIVEAHPRLWRNQEPQPGSRGPLPARVRARRYLPDFIVRVDDGHGLNDLLNLVVEVKGYRREDVKMKKLTIKSYWIPGVNQLKTYGRWAFAEFDEVYAMEADFKTT